MAEIVGSWDSMLRPQRGLLSESGGLIEEEGMVVVGGRYWEGEGELGLGLGLELASWNWVAPLCGNVGCEVGLGSRLAA